MWALSEEMLNFKGEEEALTVPVNGGWGSTFQVVHSSHVPVMSNNRNTRKHRCCVCQLEVSLSEDVSERGIRDASVGKCGCDNCIIAAHTSIRHDTCRKIHTFSCFQNITCFEIAHHPRMKGLWKNTRIGYTTCPTHPIMRDLKTLHGVTPTIRRGRARIGDQGASISGENLFMV